MSGAKYVISYYGLELDLFNFAHKDTVHNYHYEEINSGYKNSTAPLYQWGRPQ